MTTNNESPNDIESMYLNWRAYEHLRLSNQYENYLFEVLVGIPLLSLWDVSLLAATDMYYQCSIPDFINGLDWQSLNSVTDFDENTIMLLEPIQQWLSEQIIKSINENEVNPQVIGRFADSKIDAKRTYIDIQQIDNWLMCRGLNTNDDDEYSEIYIRDSLDRLINLMRNESSLLKARTYRPSFEIPPVSTDFDHLIFENATIQVQLVEAKKRHQPYRDKPNGHEERHAKNREQILGAALSVLTQWTEQCQNSSGKFEATKIAALIDSKSLLFWPETGNPPLSLEKIEREISKWINRTGK